VANQNVNSTPRWLIVIAYSLVVVIWSTTPITIKWSSEGIGHLFGVFIRMAIGAMLSLLLVLVYYRKLPLHKAACKAYSASALGLFGGMLPVYWGAQYISSGLISVIFGLSPIVTGYLAWRFIHEQSFSPMKLFGAMAGVLGLLFIFFENTQTKDGYVVGVCAVLLAVLLHAFSAVWVKSIKVDVPPLTLVAGGLLFSMPLFMMAYFIYAPPLPEIIPVKAVWSIIYLGVVGSVIGFVCFYYLLRHLATSTVALITLITPVVALWIGYAFNGEFISANVYAGTVFVLLGLGLHQWGDALFKELCKKLNI